MRAMSDASPPFAEHRAPRGRGQGPIRPRLRAWWALLLAVAVLVVALPSPGAGRRPSSPSTPSTKRGSGRPGGTHSCVQQRAQRFLIRENHLYKSGVSEQEASRRAAHRMRAIRYRIEEYGYPPGSEGVVRGAKPVADSIVPTTFMGHRIRVHRRIVRPLQCVETAIRRGCRRFPYTPQAVGGYRDYNSYHDDEVSNHSFGIAVDIDPDKNPCCGCVAPWPDNPRCKREARTPFDRMEMPRCWVETFERFGFYWLGHDQLEDTMHFEFLGNPDRYGAE